MYAPYDKLQLIATWVKQVHDQRALHNERIRRLAVRLCGTAELTTYISQPRAQCLLDSCTYTNESISNADIFSRHYFAGSNDDFPTKTAISVFVLSNASLSDYPMYYSLCFSHRLRYFRRTQHVLQNITGGSIICKCSSSVLDFRSELAKLQVPWTVMNANPCTDFFASRCSLCETRKLSSCFLRALQSCSCLAKVGIFVGFPNESASCTARTF